MADGNKLTRGGYYTHDVALLQVDVCLMDSPREHPGVETAQTLLLATLQLYDSVCHIILYYCCSTKV